MTRTIANLVTVSALALSVALGAGAAQAKEFLLGSELPLTGSLARVGQGMHEGIAVAVEMAN